MGNGGSGGGRGGTRTNAVIPDDVPAHEEATTVLMQGAGESGKSTLVRQMEIIYGNENDLQELCPSRAAYLTAVIDNVHETLEIMQAEGMTLEDPSLGKEVLKFCEISKKSANFALNKQIKKQLLKLSKDEAFRFAVTTLAAPSAQDTLLDQLQKCADPDWGEQHWEPQLEDLLMMRVRTTGSQISRKFRVGTQLIDVIDVGGQRGERPKFYKLFRSVDCILFVASLSCYNLQLYEDNQVGRLKDSLELFGKITRMSETEGLRVVVFLNKYDSFTRKFVDCKIPLPNLGGEFPAPPVLDEARVENSKAEAINWFTTCYMMMVPEERAQKIFKESFMLTNAMNRTLIDQVMRRVDWAERYNVVKTQILMDP